MESGNQVRFEPSEGASDEFRAKIAALGELRGTVVAFTGLGSCTVLLPEGVTISGHSHELPNDSYGRHYVDVSERHLRVVS